MSEIKGKRPLQDPKQATRAALLKAYDTPRELAKVARALQESCDMDEASARAVAAAARVNTLGRLAQDFGLEDDESDMTFDGGRDSHIGDSEGQFEDTDPEDEGSKDMSASPFDEDDDEDELGDGGFGDDTDDEFADEEGGLGDGMGDPMAGGGGLSDDGSGEDLVDLHFQVPASEVDEIDALLEQILGHGLEDQSDESHFSNDNDDSLMGEDIDPEGTDADLAGADDGFDESDSSEGDFAPKGQPFGGKPQRDEFDEFSPSKVASRGYSMSNNPANQQRRALRKALLTDPRLSRVASEEEKPQDIGLGKDTSHNGKPFQYSENAQYKGEAKAPTMTMEDSGGNSLQGDNPTFPKRKMYTKNPEHLHLGDAYEKATFEGGDGGEDGLEYEVKFDRTHIPSAGEADRDPGFKIPTQNPSMTTLFDMSGNGGSREASVHDVDDEFEEHMFKVLEAAGYNERQLTAMTLEDGLDAYNQIVRATTAASKQSDWFKENVLDKKSKGKGKDEEDEEMEEVGASKEAQRRSQIGRQARDLELAITAGRDGGDPRYAQMELHRIAEELRAEYANTLEHECKRIKAAYSINTQLAVNGILRPDEIDGHVEMWLDSGLTVKAMYTQGQLMLRTAESLQKQVVASADDRGMRTASRGITQVPQVVAQPSSSRFASRIDQTANQLSGLFSIGNVPRDAFDRTRAYEEAKALNPYLGMMHNPYID